jgi:hypothetical protein
VKKTPGFSKILPTFMSWPRSSGSSLPPAQVRALVEGSPGWKLLDGKEQALLDTLLSGTHNEVVSAADEMLTRLVRQPPWSQTSAEVQEAAFEMLLDWLWLPGAVNSYSADPLPVNSQARVLGTTELPDFQFRGWKGTALRHDVQVGEERFPIYEAKNPPQGPGFTHTIDEVLVALARVPAPLRRAIREISLNPVGNPDDDFWTQHKAGYLKPASARLDDALDRLPHLTSQSRAQLRPLLAQALGVDLNAPPERSRPFHSYATAGGAGAVNIYPTVWRQNVLTNLVPTLVHEIGHVLSDQAFGEEENTPFWTDWKAAEAQDRFYPSQYAATSAHEDAAEALAGYFVYLGKEAGDEFQRLFPERYKRLNKLLHPDQGRPAQAPTPDWYQRPDEA